MFDASYIPLLLLSASAGLIAGSAITRWLVRKDLEPTTNGFWTPRRLVGAGAVIFVAIVYIAFVMAFG